MNESRSDMGRQLHSIGSHSLASLGASAGLLGVGVAIFHFSPDYLPGRVLGVVIGLVGLASFYGAGGSVWVYQHGLVRKRYGRPSESVHFDELVSYTTEFDSSERENPLAPTSLVLDAGAEEITLHSGNLSDREATKTLMSALREAVTERLIGLVERGETAWVGRLAFSSSGVRHGKDTLDLERIQVRRWRSGYRLESALGVVEIQHDVPNAHVLPLLVPRLREMMAAGKEADLPNLEPLAPEDSEPAEVAEEQPAFEPLRSQSPPAPSSAPAAVSSPLPAGTNVTLWDQTIPQGNRALGVVGGLGIIAIGIGFLWNLPVPANYVFGAIVLQGGPLLIAHALLQRSRVLVGEGLELSWATGSKLIPWSELELIGGGEGEIFRTRRRSHVRKYVGSFHGVCFRHIPSGKEYEFSALGVEAQAAVKRVRAWAAIHGC